MKVHIVKSEDTWILRKIAHAIQIPGCTVGMTPDPRADLNFFISYQGFQKPTSRTLSVAWMTHRPADIDDGGWRQRKFDNVARRADFCLAMSLNTAKYCPPEKTEIWGGAADSAFRKPKLIFGVCAKISRRKRPDRIEILRSLPGIELRVSGGKLQDIELQSWFRELDYLIVTSDTEGGPYSVLEAIAAGVPVIAPDVGWCWEYPGIRYSTTEDLERIVRSLRPPEDAWGVASRDLERIFRKILKEHHG